MKWMDGGTRRVTGERDGDEGKRRREREKEKRVKNRMRGNRASTYRLDFFFDIFFK